MPVGVPTIRGRLSGGGTLTVEPSGSLRIGDGTGNGIVSPGDSDVNRGVGTLTVSSSGTNGSSTLVFASGSTFEVDICGTGEGLHDSVLVLGTGAGTGNVEIANGTTPVISLWKAPADTSIDVVILRAAGSRSGEFTNVVWRNKAGWQNLSATWVGSDLHVTGSYPGIGGLFMIQ